MLIIFPIPNPICQKFFCFFLRFGTEIFYGCNAPVCCLLPFPLVHRPPSWTKAIICTWCLFLCATAEKILARLPTTLGEKRSSLICGLGWGLWSKEKFWISNLLNNSYCTEALPSSLLLIGKDSQPWAPKKNTPGDATRTGRANALWSLKWCATGAHFPAFNFKWGKQWAAGLWN
jgi:hypothetical protein